MILSVLIIILSEVMIAVFCSYQNESKLIWWPCMHNLLKLGISIFLFSLKLAILYFITNNAKPFPPEFTLSHFCIKISLTQQTFPISIRSILFSLAVGYKVYLYSTNSEFSLLIWFVSETRETERHNKTSWWHLLHHLNDVNPNKKTLSPNYEQ